VVSSHQERRTEQDIPVPLHQQAEGIPVPVQATADRRLLIREQAATFLGLQTTV
jgi:hypothetical protein